MKKSRKSPCSFDIIYSDQFTAWYYVLVIPYNKYVLFDICESFKVGP